MHLTEEQVRRYADRRLAGDELLSVSDHLTECPSCRDRIASPAQVAGASELWRGMTEEDRTSGEHLSYEDFEAHVDGAGGMEKSRSADHLRECSECSTQLENLRAIKRQLRDAGVLRVSPPRTTLLERWRSELRGFSLAARFAVAGVAAAAIGLLLINRPPASEQQSGGQTQADRSLIRLKDRGATVVLTASGSLSGLDSAPAGMRDAAQQVLTSGRFDPPQFLAQLSGRRGTLLGDAETASAQVLTAPLATAVSSATPTFRWKAMPQAVSYVVSVYDSEFSEVAKSAPLTLTEWTPSHALPSGVVLSWQLTVRVGERNLTLPRPTDPEAKFRVLDNAALAKVDRQVKDAHDSHLLLGTIYARAGLLDEAEREFSDLAAANPAEPAAARLLAGVRGLRGR